MRCYAITRGIALIIIGTSLLLTACSTSTHFPATNGISTKANSPAQSQEPNQTLTLTPSFAASSTLTSTPTFTPSVIPTSTISPSPTQTSTPEVKPTEKPVTVLSMDVRNPTKMTEAEYWSAKIKHHEFGPEAEWKEKSNWIQDVSGFLSFYFYPNRYPDPKTRPLAVNGYAEVTRADGSVWFVVQESALTPDGNIVEWNFAWDEKDVAEPSTKVTLDWLKKAVESGKYYFVPIGNKQGDQTTCREWVSPPVCHQQDPEIAKMIDKLLKTGVSDQKLSAGFLAASFEVWNKGDGVKVEN